MPSTRYLITLIVAAQILAHSMGDLTARVRAGIVNPLLGLIGGSELSFRYGIFDIGLVIGGLFSCLISVLLGLVMLRLLFGIGWRWLGRLIPEPVEPPKPILVPSEGEPTTRHIT